MPDATKVQADAFNELQRMTASADCAVKYYETVNNIDVQYLLPQVSVPTLVLHVRGDLMQKASCPLMTPSGHCVAS